MNQEGRRNTNLNKLLHCIFTEVSHNFLFIQMLKLYNYELKKKILL